MSDNLARAAAIVAVGQLCCAAGFDAAQKSSAEVLGELLLRYIGEIGAAAHAYAESAGRTEATPVDVVSGRHPPCHATHRLCPPHLAPLNLPALPCAAAGNQRPRNVAD